MVDRDLSARVRRHAPDRRVVRILYDGDAAGA
jgi:hypothetical protein